MSDEKKYEGHTIRVGDKDWNWGMTMEKQIDELLAEVKRLQYLEKYAPTFQVFAYNEEADEAQYTQHGSVKECEEHITILDDGWIGSIEVIEDFVLTNNPQVKTIEEWKGEE